MILHGGIGTGKTWTAEAFAQRLAARGATVGGVVCPRIVRDGDTIGYTVRNLADNVEMPFSRSGKGAVSIGRFHILQGALRFAREAIESAADEGRIVFVDELGRLELQGGGHAPAVRYLLASKATAVLLVRTPFVDAVVETFSLERPIGCCVEAETRDV